MLLAFSGKKASGKSTACKLTQEIFLEEGLGLVEIKSFAEPIYKLVSEMLGVPVSYIKEHKENKQQIPLPKFSKDPIIDEGGNHWVYNPVNFRQILQTIGMNLRESDESAWVNCLFGRFDAKYIYDVQNSISWVIEDLRFENEIKRIKNLQGVVIRVMREDLICDDDNISETSLDSYQRYDFIVANDGSIDQFKKNISEIIHQIVLSKNDPEYETKTHYYW